MPSLLSGVLIAAAAVTLVVVGYVAFASARPTAWTMDAEGLTLRSALVLGSRVSIRWTEVASISFDTTLMFRSKRESIDLDGRIAWARHVTLVRRGRARAVQFTSRDLDEFERQLWVAVRAQRGWSGVGTDWHSAPAEPVACR
jgi:hypothetical protein